MVSSAATSVHNHFIVSLKNNVAILVEEQNGLRGESDGHTARRWHMVRLFRVNEVLDDGMVGGIVIIGQWELGALAGA